MAAPTATVYSNPNAPDYAAVVVPSDVAGGNFAVPTRAIFVGGAGNVSVVMAGDGQAVTFTAVAAGTTLQVRALRVNTTGTTATAMVGLW